ncbi:MAG: Uncharacterized protein JWQ25_1901 [Daejeonella sp.]|nr:Uncharacterized protein [Daejeonella sp.]
MSIKHKLKEFAEKIPPEAGILLNRLPFKLRLGTGYQEYFHLADKLIKADTITRNEYAVTNFSKVINHFISENHFIANHLKEFSQSIVNKLTLQDIPKIPLLNKSLLKNIPIGERVVSKHALKLYNTGGTSGNPLSLYLEKGVYAREWSHMHYMWKKIGYNPSMTKITVRGKNLDNLYLYNFNQNEFLINSYHSFNTDDYVSLLRVFKKYNTQFIHGYPSAIYNFLKEISIKAPFLLDFLKKNIKGIMFGSEYPSPLYRNYIEDLLTTNTISWYGHTEAVVLAGELYQKYEYVPFLSYGYAEAVKIDDYYHLVGTSFSNLASPFIRYDTEDLIEPNFDEQGSLLSFQIKEGRTGEFVIDKVNKNISLTALIFGRHHKLFDLVDFIQVKQPKAGEIIIYYSKSSSIDNPSDLFDSKNVNIDMVFEQIEKPFKTTLGKIPLLVK